MELSLLIQRIDAVTAAFDKHFGKTDYVTLNRQPNPTTWSVSQNIDHLMIINDTYFPTFEQLRAGSYKQHWLGKLGFFAKWMGRAILKSVEPTRQKKMKTLRIWEPSEGNFPDGMIGRFKTHQEKLKKEFRSLESLIGKGLVISSPANPAIVYPLEVALDIIVTHEERHLAQSLEVAGVVAAAKV